MQCAKCGDAIPDPDAVEATLESSTMRENCETQSIFFHKKCVADILDSGIPLHPDLLQYN